MARQTTAGRAATWTVILSSVFVLTVGAVLIALVVGDWLYIHTANVTLSWVVGFFVLLGYLVTLGGGVGILLWIREGSPPSVAMNQKELAESILAELHSVSKD